MPDVPLKDALKEARLKYGRASAQKRYYEKHREAINARNRLRRAKKNDK